MNDTNPEEDGRNFVIYVERDADLPLGNNFGYVEVWGPFTEAEAENELDDDCSPLLGDNCTDMVILPLCTPDWLPGR